MFKLTLDDLPQEHFGEQALKGRIQLSGKLDESYLASLTFWQREDYINHWNESLKSVLELEPKVAFISNMIDPEQGSFIRCYVCYTLGSQVGFQEHILFLDELSEKFQLENIHTYIHDRQTEPDEDGIMPS
tara:strand:+ start:518 stop:910 length:393 start_codon:yes stop_codon:yes gene_type:complete